MGEHVEVISVPQEYRFVESFSELSSTDHFWYRWRFKAFIRQAEDLGIPLDRPFDALDVGAGVGMLRRQLEDATSWTVDITDIDHAALQKSEEGRGRTYYYDITEQRPEWKEKYDAITVFDVIEHIEKPEPFVNSLLYHLKKGGYLFINVPALSMLFSRFDEVQGHYRRYTTDSLRSELDGHGIEILDARYWGLSNVPFLLLRRFMLRYLAGKKTDEEIFREGFAPASSFVNESFVRLMNVETRLTSRPPLGSSVLLAARKL